MILDFQAAVSFLTRLPVGSRLQIGPKEVGRASRWFPLVGGLLGAIAAGCFLLFDRIFPPVIDAILLIAIEALLTGAMHFDGLADTADGFGGGATREDVLRIMRDHAIGSYGAVALILAVALQAAAIAQLIEARLAVRALVLSPVLGRWSAVLLSATLAYARPPDATRVTAGAPSRFVGRLELFVATVTAVFLAFAIGGWRGGIALAGVGAFAAVWGLWCRRRIGGITGDTLGAAIQISECLVLLTLAVG